MTEATKTIYSFWLTPKSGTITYDIFVRHDKLHEIKDKISKKSILIIDDAVFLEQEQSK